MKTVISNFKVFGLQIAGYVCVALLLSGCYTPPPIPAVLTPIPVSLQELVLGLDDLPRLQTHGTWLWSEPFDAMEDWIATNAVAAMEAWYHYGSNAPLTYTIVQYGDSIGADFIWNERKDLAVIMELGGEVVAISDIFTSEELPSLHADKVALACEQYHNLDSYEPFTGNCVARLQYGVIYLQITAAMGKHAFSPAQFHELLETADNRLQPFWNVRSATRSSTTLPNPTTEITHAMVDSGTVETIAPTLETLPVTAMSPTTIPAMLERWQSLHFVAQGSSKTR